MTVGRLKKALEGYNDDQEIYVVSNMLGKLEEQLPYFGDATIAPLWFVIPGKLKEDVYIIAMLNFTAGDSVVDHVVDYIKSADYETLKKRMGVAKYENV